MAPKRSHAAPKRGIPVSPAQLREAMSIVESAKAVIAGTTDNVHKIISLGAAFEGVDGENPNEEEAFAIVCATMDEQYPARTVPDLVINGVIHSIDCGLEDCGGGDVPTIILSLLSCRFVTRWFQRRYDLPPFPPLPVMALNPRLMEETIRLQMERLREIVREQGFTDTANPYVNRLGHVKTILMGRDLDSSYNNTTRMSKLVVFMSDILLQLANDESEYKAEDVSEITEKLQQAGTEQNLNMAMAMIAKESMNTDAHMGVVRIGLVIESFLKIRGIHDLIPREEITTEAQSSTAILRLREAIGSPIP
jgi:hypothetical protein